MPTLARASLWVPLATILVIVLLVVAIDVREQRHAERTAALEVVSMLFGGESGRALLEHPLAVSACRVGTPGAHSAVPDAATVHALVGLLEEPASYEHDQNTAFASGMVAVRFENEQGSLTVAVSEDGRMLEVSRDGNRISEAVLGPAQEHMAALLRRLVPGAVPQHAR